MGWSLIERLPSLKNQRSIPFYLAWATRIYTLGDGGYRFDRTPDDRPLTEQDAYFMRCVETIVGTWNQKIAEERKRG